MAQYIFNHTIRRNAGPWRFFMAMRRLILLVADPLVMYEFHGSRIRLPLSHQLPQIRAAHPTYGENLSRLAAFLRVQDGFLAMVDAGANVGDTAVMTNPQSGDQYLLIEGEPRFFTLLQENTKGIPGASPKLAMLSDVETHSSSTLRSGDGNASVVSASPAAGIAPRGFTTLDRLMEEVPGFGTANLVKTDVEGFDAKVLAGAARLIREDHPVLFFEFHPEKMAGYGISEADIFPRLESMGYARAVFYDNLGISFQVLPIGDLFRIRQLVDRTRRTTPYFDVCAFPQSRFDQERDFLESERSVSRPEGNAATAG